MCSTHLREPNEKQGKYNLADNDMPIALVMRKRRINNGIETSEGGFTDHNQYRVKHQVNKHSDKMITKGKLKDRIQAKVYSKERTVNKMEEESWSPGTNTVVSRDTR